MEIQGTHQFSAPLDQVWDALMNPAILSKALPGGDQLERVGENDYKAAMNVRVGPVQGRFEGQVTLSDIKEHEGYHMKVSGTGAPGFLNGEGNLTLAANDDGTLLTYAGDVQVGGRIAAVGQRLIDSTAKSIIRQGLKTLDEQLQRGDASEPPPAQAAQASTAPDLASKSTTTRADETSQARTATPPPATHSSSSASSTGTSASSTSRTSTSNAEYGRMAFDVAKEVVQDLASDYVPREKQPQLFAFVAGAVAMLLFVILVRLVQRD